MLDKKNKKRAPYGENHFWCKYPDSYIIQILDDIKDGIIEKFSDISKYNVSERLILGFLKNEFRTYLTPLYDFDEMYNNLRIHLNTCEVNIIKTKLANGESAAKISKDMILPYANISKIKNGYTYS